MSLVITLADGGALVRRPPVVPNITRYLPADGGEQIVAQGTSEAPDPIYPSDFVLENSYGRPKYPSIWANVRYWIDPNLDRTSDFLGGDHTYLSDLARGSGTYDWPGMLPDPGYKVVTDRGNPISFTDYVAQNELYS